MEESRNTTIWVGSDLGYLKTVDIATNVVVNYGEAGEHGRKSAPSTLLWRDPQEDKLLVGKMCGKLQVFSCESRSFESPELDCGDSPIRGIGVFEHKVFACTDKGFLTCWSETERQLEKNVGDNVRKMKQNSSKPNVFATGGKENDLKVFDINAIEKPIFAAKNVRNDFLDLRQPVWVNDICFFDGDESKVVVATGHHSIKLYDTRKQKRPISSIEWESYPITALSVAANGNDIIMGNTFGSIASMDLRTSKLNGHYKGAAGSITSLDCHKEQYVVAAISLDRFLRIYNTRSRSLLQKFYLKSPLSSVILSQKNYTGELFGKPVKAEKQKVQSTKDTKDTDEAGDPSDLLWSQMAVANDEVPAKKRKKKVAK